MKERRLEIIENGVFLGHILVFRGPRFTNYHTGYTAIGIDGMPIGCVQSSKASAIELLKRHV